MMVWVVGLLIFGLVFALGAIATVLWSEDERWKAAIACSVAVIVSVLAVHFSQVAAEIKSTASQLERQGD